MGRALVTEGRGEVALVDRPALVAGAGELIVRPLAVGVCGTDVELVDGLVDAAFVRYPLVLGHEWVGVVSGGHDGGYEPGDPVVVEGIVPCWSCERCLAGETHLCTTGYDEVGFTRDGAAADEIAVPSRLVHRLAPGIDPADAALVEPAAVVYHGLSRTVGEVGQRCLVVGDGTVALLAAHLLRLWSPGRVEMLALRSEQEVLAAAVGVDAVRYEAPGPEFDFVVEAAGTNEATLSALGSARRGGRVLLLGLPPHGTTARVPVDDLINNDLLIRSSFGYSASAFAKVAALLGTERCSPRLVVTHRFALDQHAEAFALLRRPEPGEARGKILLFPEAP